MLDIKLIRENIEIVENDLKKRDRPDLLEKLKLIQTFDNDWKRIQKEVEELRKERADQQDYASLETVKKWGLEKGADFILQGVVNSITDANTKEKVVYYQVDLSLSDLESNEKVWIGTKKIKKVVK